MKVVELMILNTSHFRNLELSELKTHGRPVYTNKAISDVEQNSTNGPSLFPSQGLDASKVNKRK